MPVIQTNLSALIAQNAARASEMQTEQSMQRLSMFPCVKSVEALVQQQQKLHGW